MSTHIIRTSAAYYMCVPKRIILAIKIFILSNNEYIYIQTLEGVLKSHFKNKHVDQSFTLV